MWIIDCPIKQGDPEIQSYVISNRNKSYIFGSKKGNLKDLDIPIITELVLSRRQLEFKLDSNTGWLLAKNIGSRSIFLREEGFDDFSEQLPVKSPTWRKVKTNSVFYKKDSTNIIELIATKLDVKDITINARVNSILGDEFVSTFEFHVNKKLANDEIVINDKISKIKEVSTWLNQLLECKWKVNGGLANYLVPEIENCEVIEIPPSDNDEYMNADDLISPPPLSQQKKHNITPDVDEFVSMTPPLNINSQMSLPTQAKREQDSLLGMIMADDEDLRSQPRRRKTKKKKMKEEPEIKKTLPVVSEETSIANDEIVDLKEHMDNLSVKKRPTEEIPIDNKRVKIEKQSTSLVDNIIKVREMKLERIKKDNELMKIGSESAVKVSKFQVKLLFDQQPTCKLNSSFTNPEWQNRVNFSKFQKSSTGYNPVMDSTIEYIKMKSSNYNSTSAQSDAHRHEYLLENDNIPVFDNEFGDSNSNGGRTYPNKRTRNSAKTVDMGPSLFVPSDEDTDDDSKFQSRQSSTRRRKSTVAESFNKRKTAPPKIKMSILSEVEDSEEDDIPIFKAQRRY